MNSAKKRAIILMVSGAVIGAVAVGAYLLQGNTMSPTAETPPTATSTPSIFDMEPIIPEAKVSTEGWKTCRNEEYGYEFKFPAEWKIYGEDALSEPNALGKRNFVRESEECNGASVFLSAFEPWSGAVSTEEDGGIYVEARLEQMSEDDYWSSYSSRLSNNTQSFPILINYKIGVMGISGQIRSDGSRSWGARTINQEKTYWLYGDFYDKQSDTIYSTLSTFRFLDTATTSEEVVRE